MSARLMVLGVLFLHSVSSDLDQSTKRSLELMSNSIDRSAHHHYHESPTFQGFWKKKFIWKPRWVKTWQEKKIYVAMWSPAEVKEWVLVAKPPPGWVKHFSGHFVKVGLPH